MDQVLPGFTGFSRVLPSFSELHPSISRCNDCFADTVFTKLSAFTDFYQGFTGFYRVLPSFTRFTKFDCGITRLYWVLLGFTEV